MDGTSSYPTHPTHAPKLHPTHLPTQPNQSTHSPTHFPLQEKVANDPNVKAAVLISAKPDNFIAGADIKFIDSVDDFSMLKDGPYSYPPTHPPYLPMSYNTSFKTLISTHLPTHLNSLSQGPRHVPKDSGCGEAYCCCHQWACVGWGVGGGFVLRLSDCDVEFEDGAGLAGG